MTDTPGRVAVADCAPGVDALRVSRAGARRPHHRPEAVTANKANSSRAIRRVPRRRGVQAVVPKQAAQQANRARRGKAGGGPPAFALDLHEARDAVERRCNRFQRFRAIATRFDALATRYEAGLPRAALVLRFRIPDPDRSSDAPCGPGAAWPGGAVRPAWAPADRRDYRMDHDRFRGCASHRALPAGDSGEDRLGHAHVPGCRKDVRHHPRRRASFAVRCPMVERQELIAAEPAKFWVPPHEASSHWVRVRIAALDDQDELRDIVVDSWKQAAPPRLLESFTAPA